MTTLKRLANHSAVALLVLVVSCLAFWKFRVIDTEWIPNLTLQNVDLFTEHYPMVKYGFGMLKDGHFPLWNPYQLCGIPFMAVPHVGLLYPGNLVYLLTDTGMAIEISFVSHLVFGGLGMWLLAREYRLSSLGGLAGAMTFMWSGWMVFYAQQPSLVAGMSWLPLTVWLVERTIRGRRFAPVGLALAVACQVLNGATEFFVYNMYVCGAVTLFRLAQMGLAGNLSRAVKVGVRLLTMVVAGILLAGPQLFPSLELVGMSGRSGGSLTLAAARSQGVVRPTAFLSGIPQDSGIAFVGFLPFLGLILGAGARGRRSAWLLAAALALLAASLATGGKVFELYFYTPLGDLFRRPHKFLHIYAFAQAVAAAIAISWLMTAEQLDRRRLWSRWEWIAALLVSAFAIYGSWLQGGVNAYMAAAVAALLVFGTLPAGRWRTAPILGLLMLQATNLFLAAAVPGVRPSQQPGVFDTSKGMFSYLRTSVGNDARVYLSSRFLFSPPLTLKQGLLNRLPVIFDYEVLAPKRHAAYIEHIANRPPARTPSSGALFLGSKARLRLLDLMSTRYYVVPFSSDLEATLRRMSRRPSESGITRIKTGPLRIYQRRDYLPRAYFVAQARVADGPDMALASLDDDNFDPRNQVVLEAEGKAIPSSNGPSQSGGKVWILESRPERVAMSVIATKPGFLVLTDSYYPGWHAYVSGVEQPIYRANYLFRAVAIEPGASEVVFEYHPDSLRYGVYAASASALLLLGFAWSRRRRPTVV